MTPSAFKDTTGPLGGILSWQGFKEVMLRFSRQPKDRRAQFLFRGQSDFNFTLTTTLDRFRNFTSDLNRNQWVKYLLDEFRREAALLQLPSDALPDGEALELIARHHGLPSRSLDWTESPYIASYFAFEGQRDSKAISIWVIDRGKIPDSVFGALDIDVIDDRMLLRFNRRALQQKSVFLRVNSIRLPLIEMLRPSLYRFDVDAQDCDLAFADLDVMNINGATLFNDFDGVARTVKARIKPETHK